MEKIIIKCDPDLEELIPGYLNNRQKDILALGTALQENDFESIRIIGHSMKGSGGGYGFDQITEIGGQIESAAQTNDASLIEQSVAQLEDYLNHIEVEYN